MSKRKVFFFKFDFRKSNIITEDGEEVVQDNYLDSKELKPLFKAMFNI